MSDTSQYITELPWLQSRNCFQGFTDVFCASEAHEKVSDELELITDPTNR